MSSKTCSYLVENSTVKKITVEVSHSTGIPGLVLIGLAKKAVIESKERIKSALFQTGLRLKSKRTVVNLHPTHIPKTSPSLDLAIIAAALQENQMIENDLSEYVFLAEIGLNGELRPVPGLLHILNSISGTQKIIISIANKAEAQLHDTHTIFAYSHLAEVINHFRQPHPQPITAKRNITASKKSTKISTKYYFKQSHARALQIAAAGRHHCLFIGPPGSGKTTSAQILGTLQPSLSPAESRQITGLASLSQPQHQVISTRPFIAPHHAISLNTLVGSATMHNSGLLSKAHQGILFLDEITSFKKNVLQSLREPMEQKSIRLFNLSQQLSQECDFQLVATANPCNCGYYGSSTSNCSCSSNQRTAFMDKITQPLLERFEMIIWLEHTKLTTHLPDQPTKFNIAALPKKSLDLDALQSKLTKKGKRLITKLNQKKHANFRSLRNLLSVAETISFLESKSSQNVKITDSAILEARHYQYQIN